jgi:hypothetical protein
LREGSKEEKEEKLIKKQNKDHRRYVNQDRGLEEMTSVNVVPQLVALAPLPSA